MTLPPEIPLTAEEEKDRLLTPLPDPEPLMYVGDDCWELVTDKQCHRFENCADMFQWLYDNKDEIRRAQVFHRRRGDFI